MRDMSMNANEMATMIEIKNVKKKQNILDDTVTFLHAVLHKIPQRLTLDDEEEDGFLSLGSNIGQV